MPFVATFILSYKNIISEDAPFIKNQLSQNNKISVLYCKKNQTKSMFATNCNTYCIINYTNQMICKINSQKLITMHILHIHGHEQELSCLLTI